MSKLVKSLKLMGKMMGANLSGVINGHQYHVDIHN